MMNEVMEVQVQGVNKKNKENKKKQKMEYIIEGDVAKFTTSQGIEFTVDAEDAPRVAEHTWCVNNHGYLHSWIKGKLVKIHRFILGLNSEDKILVDHMDRNKLNNCKSNLRLCNNQENAWNTDAKGYTKTPDGKYCVRINVDGKDIYLGCFETEEQAKAVRILDGEKKYFGEFSSNKHLFDDPKTKRLYEEAMENVVRYSKYNEYTINGDIVILKASNCNEEFIIDLEDLKLIENHTWRIHNGSVIGKIDGVNQLLSRHLLDLKTGDKRRVKFIDGNNHNLKRENLQVIEFKSKKKE